MNVVEVTFIIDHHIMVSPYSKIGALDLMNPGMTSIEGNIKTIQAGEDDEIIILIDVHAYGRFVRLEIVSDLNIYKLSPQKWAQEYHRYNEK